MFVLAYKIVTRFVFSVVERDDGVIDVFAPIS
jgi:hypothetical protein